MHLPSFAALLSLEARGLLAICTLPLLLSGCAVTITQTETTPEALRQQVMATERAFAQSMADRDVQAFARFVADEAVFFASKEPLTGKTQVVAFWSKFFTGAQAPFSWEPDQVEVLASGTLALSSGPVHDPSGKRVARFTSVWRKTADNRWQIVFDKGNDVCP